MDRGHLPRFFPPLSNETTADCIKLKQGVSQYGLETDFVFLCGLCASVVCARVSPRQKSLVVSMVRAASPTVVTLSVGDGANDVPMLQVSRLADTKVCVGRSPTKCGLSGFSAGEAAHS